MSSCDNEQSGCVVGNSVSTTERRSKTALFASQAIQIRKNFLRRLLEQATGLVTEATFIFWQLRVFRFKVWKERKLWMIVFESLKPTTQWPSPGILISIAKNYHLCSQSPHHILHLRHWSIPCVNRNNLSLASQRTSLSGGTGGWDSMRKLMLNILKLCWKNALNLKCHFTSWGMKTWWLKQKRNGG